MTTIAANLIGQNVEAWTTKYGYITGSIIRVTCPNWMGKCVVTITGVKENLRRYTAKGLLVYENQPDRTSVPATFTEYCWLNRRRE